MPIYEYRCPDCGHEFETFQKMSDDPIRTCPACGAGEVKKLISQTAFVLKGGGWYKDHYGLKTGGGSGTEAAPAAGGKEAAPAAASPTTGGSTTGGGSSGGTAGGGAPSGGTPSSGGASGGGSASASAGA